MIDEKIAEIRERHSRDDRWRNTLPQMHEDRATLLAEVERQRAENERLRAEIDGLEAELALMKSGFEIAYRAMGDKP